MPNPPIKYYPALKNLITFDAIPTELDFIKNLSDSIFRKIYYKDLQMSVSDDGSTAFYNLRILTKDRLEFDLFFGLKFVLNRDFDDQGISSFPVTVYYNWPIIAYLKAFDLQNFSFAPSEFYEVGLTVFDISEEDVLAYIIETFVSPDSTDGIHRLIDDINTTLGDELSSPLPYPDINSTTKFKDINAAVEERYGKSASMAVFTVYMFHSSDLQATMENVNNFFGTFISGSVEEYILNIIKPQATVTLETSASIEFPRDILVPWNNDGSAPDPNPDSRVYFDFAKSILYADTDEGIGYQAELAGTLNPAYCELGKTGLLIQIESLKLDLSRKTNIPEAIADDRPLNFTGVYARTVSVTLPARWFHDDSIQGTPANTLRLAGYNLLIGTGGFSGTLMLETVPSIITGGTTYYFEDKFEINFPILIFEKNDETNKIEEIVINNLLELKAKLFPSGSSIVPPNPIKFPITITELPATDGIELTFENLIEYQQYLNSLESEGPSENNPAMWKRIGSDSGFKIGFSHFDITFKQNKVVSSNIKGALKIQKFTYPPEHDLYGSAFQMQIEGHIDDDGGFNLTATTQPFPIVLKDVFTYNLKTVELGRENDESPFYIGTSGTLQFEGFLKEFLKLGPIEIQSLRIYSDGSMEFSGGSINLLEPIVMKLGPVDLTVSAIHYGSHQKEVNGVMRKYNYFGFDGGLNVDPLGVEIRGDGIKFYYCTDNDSHSEKLEPYVHIQTIYVDLTLPASTPVAIINGWLSIPEPGVSQEYAGGMKLQLPKANITGSVDMKLSPRYPAFILDASLEFPAPIPLGSFAIYGFRGLLGYRYVAEKEAIGVNTWYEYYKAPPRGIHPKKFRQPIDTAGYANPFSIGAGASLGTSFDNGTVLNLKVMLLLSIPSVFMLDGRAAILSARLGLESTKEPPFFLMAAIGDNSLEMGFGADFKMPTKDGSILTLYAEMQAAFFFNDSSKWYVNFGTKEKPTTATILSLIDLKSYLMLSAKGIEAGARGEFDFKRTYANIIKVHAWAYIEVGGKISFERPQFGAYLDAGIGADIDVKFVSLSAAFDILFAVEASEPFLIYGRVRIKIKIRILWVFKFSFNAEVEVLWEKSKYVNRSPITPLIQQALLDENPNLLNDLAKNAVKGVNMLSNEVFDLAYLGMGTISPNAAPTWHDYIIPLDTYIDIKTQKGLLPNSISNIIGGVASPPERYTDLVPPDKNVRGKELRQVKHQYSITGLTLSAWDETAGVWKDYHPYKALYPDDDTQEYNNLKIGQFQKTDGQYNTIRLLATTPFSYTEQGQPGWYIPEQYGITASSFFCEGEALTKICANFLEKPLGQRYYCFDNNHMFYSREAAFLLIDKEDEEYAEVTDHPNVFQMDQSLAFDIHNKLQILLPEPSVSVRLKLTSDSQAVRIRYFCSVVDDDALEVRYGNPNPVAFTRRSSSYTVLVNVRDLDKPIEYHKPQWRPITKIIIEPVYAVRSLLVGTLDNWQLTLNHNLQIQLGSLAGQYQSPIPFMTKYDYLNSQKGTVQLRTYIFDPANNRYMDKDKQVWLQSWDTHNDTKISANPIGFSLSGNSITVEGKYQLIDIDFEGDSNMPDVDNQGMRAIAEVQDIADHINADGYIELQVSDYVNCLKHLRLCSLRHLLKAAAANFVHPDIVTSADFPRIQKAMLRFKDETVAFDQQYPDYGLAVNTENEFRDIDAFIAVPDIKTYPKAYQAAAIAVTQIAVEGDCECDDCVKDNVLCGLYTLLADMLINCIRDPRQKIAWDLNSAIGCVNEFRGSIESFDLDNPSYGLTATFQDQIAIIDAFLANPTMQNYTLAYAAMQEIIAAIAEKGNCKCGVNTDALEDLYDSIKDILDDHFQDLDNIKDLTDQIRYVEFILDLIQQFHNQYPGLDLPGNLAEYIKDLEDFLNDPNAGTLADALAAIIKILDYLNQLGLGTFAKLPKKTLLHEVCWLSLESYEYNLNIPSQEAISADVQATVAGIERYIQPIWKPDTQYMLQFKLKDNVDNGSANSREYSYLYGFATAGPVGHFHTDANTDYGTGNPDTWPLTSLKRYIDYERSYPYADGNLLSSKPLFYNDDEISQIFMFYSKSYATHFFQDWQAYPNESDEASERSGRIKIIIKDPAEGASIVNPPYLDYNDSDVTTIHIPQTIESWRTDNHPQLPFVINQFSNLYNTPGNCVSSGGDPIKPASQYTSIRLKHLKPLKLYTAIVNNLYDDSGTGDYADPSKTKEVHRFVFQTSRYANFEEQINSYILKGGTGDDYVERKAIFTHDQAFLPQQINDAYNIVSTPDVTDALSTKYQHAFDRLVEGVLGLNPLDAAISTEFNIIRNTADNDKVVAIIIRNPEPFNIPRIPLAEIADTIQVMHGGTPNASYKILHSKDYSQAIIMHDSKVINANNLSIRFMFKKWDGYAFTEFGNHPIITIEI